ncbi:MAG: FkbM family methyltransferase, partial [Sulfurimonas sp.]|nr:FkbM family methyltransferase [Sulfurimonas sp.]
MTKPTQQELNKIDISPNKLKKLLRKAYWLFSVYLPKQHDSIVLTRNGRLMFNSKDKTTGRILHVSRHHEINEMIETVDLLRNEDIIDNKEDSILVDVGGYIGMSSTGFLLNNKFQKALSFEPSPKNFRLLQKNIVLNGLEDRITPYNIALSDEKGTLDFELSNKNYGDNRVRKTSKNGQYGESERSVISIEANT